METAVYVDIVARSIPQTVAAQQTDRTGYILRCSPSAQWGKVPFSIRLSYLPCTLLVMSVAITPGRTSLTRIPSALPDGLHTESSASRFQPWTRSIHHDW